MCKLLVTAVDYTWDDAAFTPSFPSLVVAVGMPGFTKGKKLNKMGLKAQDTSELFFEDVKLPKSALLGKENGGFYLLMSELPQERLLIAVMGLASAEAVYELTRKYVTERKAFGKTLKDLQVGGGWTHATLRR